MTKFLKLNCKNTKNIARFNALFDEQLCVDWPVISKGKYEAIKDKLSTYNRVNHDQFIIQDADYLDVTELVDANILDQYSDSFEDNDCRILTTPQAIELSLLWVLHEYIDNSRIYHSHKIPINRLSKATYQAIIDRVLDQYSGYVDSTIQFRMNESYINSCFRIS